MGLTGLALRRTASRGAIAWATLVAVAIALASSAPPAAWLEAGASDPHVAGGLARESAWSGFLLAVAPMIVLRAARDAAFWRRRDSAWLASRSVSNSTVFVSAWLGVALASLAFACAFGALAELNAGGGDAHDPRRAGSLVAPGGAWIDGAKPLAWRAEENAACREAIAAGGARARIELGLGGGAGAACQVILRARRAAAGSVGSAGAWTEEARTSIGNRGAIEVVVPRGSGPLEFEIELGTPESRLFVLGEELEVYAQSSRAHAASLAIFTRVALALLAWTAFALGCSAWVSAPTAALAVLAALAPAWWSGGTGTSAFAWLPGADVFEAIGIVGAGRVPAELGAGPIGGAIAVVCAGLAIGLAGLRRWRQAP
jgi:hypothetical protein